MIKADCHVHSLFSSDGEDDMRAEAVSAVQKELDTICFTEHMDFDYPNCEFRLDTPAYLQYAEQLKKEFEGRLEILSGVELGLMDNITNKLSEFIKSFDFDFIIGSSHLVDGLDPYEPDYFKSFGDKNGILRYFESVLKNIAAFSDFDVYGHLDYVVRYSLAKSYQPLDFKEIIDEILKKIIDMGKGIELNTAGLKYNLGFAHPHPYILKRYHDLGGKIITVGSDAHSALHIAYDFNAALHSLENAGFKYYTVFRKRKPEFYSIFDI